MGKGRRIPVAVWVLATLGVLVLALLIRPELEPVYRGKQLREWLVPCFRPGLVGGDESDAADDAAPHIGTNGIPTLLRMLRARDSIPTAVSVALARRWHLINIRYEDAPS